MKRRWVAVGVALLTVCWIGTAQSKGKSHKPTHPQRFRIFGGGISEGPLEKSMTLDGKAVDEGPGQVASLGFMAGYEHTLLGRYGSMMGLARWEWWPTDGSQDAGESRMRLDLGVAPVASVPFRFRLLRAEKPMRLRVYAYTPVGLTLPWIEAGPHRGISQSYRAGRGYHYGAMLGLALRSSPARNGRAGGGFVELGYLVHRMSFSHEVQTTSPPIRIVAEEARFVERSIVLSAGVELLF